MFALFLAALPVQAMASASLEIEQLMARLRRVKSATAHYTEHRELAMLSAPLESTGTLTYVAPNRLEKSTLTPRPERFVIEGERMTAWQADGKSRSVSLSEAPELGAMIESIRATLAGDAASLERYFTLQAQGTLAEWQLLLLPKQPRLQSLLASIRIAGREGEIRVIETVEQGGDHTVTTIIRDELHEAPQ